MKILLSIFFNVENYRYGCQKYPLFYSLFFVMIRKIQDLTSFKLSVQAWIVRLFLTWVLLLINYLFTVIWKLRCGLCLLLFGFSPKRSRRDGKPETERVPSNTNLNVEDNTDREQKHRRRLQDALHYLLSLLQQLIPR